MLDLISCFPHLLNFPLYFPLFNLLTLVLSDFFNLVLPMVTATSSAYSLPIDKDSMSGVLF